MSTTPHQPSSFRPHPSSFRPHPSPFTPSDRDRVIFKWVKFDGRSQGWVAQQLNVHQSTISRVIERYERWIARGGPSESGGMTRDERLRYQRWMTYERNELLLTSCLRLAAEMEQTLDTTKSNILHHASEPSRDLEIRTEHKVLDRSGNACRYLRLAFRLNMEQLKLVAQDELDPLPPLTIDEGDPALDDVLILAFAADSAEPQPVDNCPVATSPIASNPVTSKPVAPEPNAIEPISPSSGAAPLAVAPAEPTSPPAPPSPDSPTSSPVIIPTTSPAAVTTLELTRSTSPKPQTAVHKTHTRLSNDPEEIPYPPTPYSQNHIPRQRSHAPSPKPVTP